MPLPSYSTGTLSVAANGTAITGTGTLWATNVRAGDILLVAQREVTIEDVTSETALVIDPWPGAAQSNVAYKIIYNNPQRVVGAQGRASVDRLVAALEADGFFIFVPVVQTVPDPSKGNDGQYAFQPATGKLWIKSGGAWSYLGIYKALSYKGAWSGAPAFAVNDVVTSGGSAYIATAPSTNQPPPNATYWDLLASKGDPGPQGAQGPAGANGTNGTNGTNAPRYGGTSTTSLAIAIGSKVFATQANLAYLPGARVRATSAGNLANWMEGTADYSGTTLTMNVDRVNGSGTFADWNFNVVGMPGAGNGDVIAAANNTLTGSNTINGPTTFGNAFIQRGGYAQFGEFNADGVHPQPDSALAFGINKSSGRLEIDIINTRLPSTSPNTGFKFLQMLTATTYRDVLNIDVNGNLLSPASTYLNYGTGVGAAGYGLRDNAGTIERKNSGGAWAAIQAAAAALNALAGLTPAADTLGYFTSASAAASTALTTLARTLLGNTTGAQMFATMGSAQALGTSGYVKLPGGLILQYGASAGDAAITYPVAFTTFARPVGTAMVSGAPGSDQIFNVSMDQGSLTGFAGRCRTRNNTAGASSGESWNWMAIGF